MDHVRRHRFLRRCLIALPLLLLIAVAAPAGADQDGYIDNFPGDAVFTPNLWSQSTGSYQPIPGKTVTLGGELKNDFDAAWDAASQLPTPPTSFFCTTLDGQIKSGDDGYDGENHCEPTQSAQGTELRAKMLGTGVVGLRYFVPGRDRTNSIYAYDHSTFLGDENIDVSFDVTIDVVIRVAPGVGPESDSFTPLSVQSATLTFTRASFTASICTDACANAETTMNGKVLDIKDQVSLERPNAKVHTNVANSLPTYFGLKSSLSATAVNFALNLDALPALDATKPPATVRSTVRLGNLLISTQNLYGVDTSGTVWQQTSLFGLPYQHWVSLPRPSGVTIALGVAATVDANGTPNVWTTTNTGRLYQYNGTTWVNRGAPNGVSVVGTPAAGSNAGKSEVFVRTTNSHIAGLIQTAANAFTWVDLGQLTTPGVALTPAVVVNGGYTDVVVTRSNGTLWSREAVGPFWGAWRDLGALPSPAVTAPSSLWDGSNVSVYVSGVDHTIESARFAPLQSATVGRVAPPLFGSLPPVTSTPVAVVTTAGLPPTIYATDANGDLWEVVYRKSNIIALNGYHATDLGTLMNTTMNAPLALPSGNAFSIAANHHAGETQVTATGLNTWVDHMPRSRVTAQAHYSLLSIAGFGPPVEAGQTANTAFGNIIWPADWFRVQSTTEGLLMCQAYAAGIGWLAEVPAGQPCGAPGHAVDAIRFRLADGNFGTHVVYRCNTGTWSPWFEDGMTCSAPNLASRIGAIQVELADTPAPAVSYRAHSEGDPSWQPFGNEGATVGTFGKAIEGLEVASNVGGEVRCQPITQNGGVQEQVQNNFDLCGTVGQGNRLEGFTLMVADGPPGVGVQYRSFITGSGWGPWCANGQVSGAPGDQIEAVQVQMTHSP